MISPHGKSCANILQNISFSDASLLAELSKAPSSDVVLCQKALRSNSLICLVGRSEGWKTDRTLLSLILNHDSTAHTFLSLFSPPNHSNDQRPAPKQNIHTALGTGPRPLGSRVMSELFINVDSTSHFVFCVRSKLHWDRNGPNVQILLSKRKENLPRTPRCLGPRPVFTALWCDG